MPINPPHATDQATLRATPMDVFPTDPAKLAPLLIDERTGEPYLQLPSPHERIRITPPREADVDSIVQHMNDPRIFEYLASPPHPYSRDDGIKWSQRIRTASQAVFREIETGAQFVSGCPVRSIREIQEDGSDVYIGDILIDRENDDVAWISSSDANNSAKSAGDPSILYSIGDYLSPTHHRQGIMSAVLNTVLASWAIPRMNCRRIVATAFIGNVASVGVFKKAGFKHTRDQKDAARLPEGRGGHLRDLHIMERTDRKSVV